MHRLMFALVTAVLLSLAHPGILHSQGLTGQISGVVTDPTGAAVPSAVVQIINSQTGQVRSTKVNEDGHFVFTELLPGTFTLTIDAAGFKKFEQKDIPVAANERV